MRTWVSIGCVSTAVTLVLALGACAARDPESDGTATDRADQEPVTFIFAASADPAGLDPALAGRRAPAYDAETSRVTRQIFEGLVGSEPGTGEPAPLLAESWHVGADGLTYTFDLREDVTFHDGTPFDADAVCANFDRWDGFTGTVQSDLAGAWATVNGGFASSDVPSLDGTGAYSGCEATDATTAVVRLRRPLPALLSALATPALSMQSPTALERYAADEVGGDATAPTLSRYATSHPTGTGPYVLEEWTRGQQITLTAFDGYWGEQGQIRRVVLPIIPDPADRREALESGDIDGYDGVGPVDAVELERAGFRIVTREPFTVLYLAMDQANPDLAVPEVRQAIAHAIDKEALVASTLPRGTQVAASFVPPSVPGWTDQVPLYDHDPQRARELLASVDRPSLTVHLTYPTQVSRPDMPTPEGAFRAIAADLAAVGITVDAVPEEWSPDDLDRGQGTSVQGLHLRGWTGDDDADSFIGALFGGPSAELGFDDPAVSLAVDGARGRTDPEERAAAYRAANQLIMQRLPAVPLAHPAPTLALASGVEGFPSSPPGDEVYNVIRVER